MLQAVARPGSLAEAHAILASRDGAVIIAGGTVVMPILNYGTDAFDTLVSLRGSGLSGISIAGGRATIGAMTTLSDLQEKRRARLPLASARHHRLADRPQHGDRRRQSVRQAALWRPRRLPDRARRDGVDFRAVGRAQRAGRKDRRRSARPRRDRHQRLLRAARRRHVQVPQGGAQGVQFRGDRHGRGGRLGQRRQGSRVPHRPRRRRRHRRSARRRSRRR